MREVNQAPKGAKVAIVDWKDSVNEVLKQVDAQLKDHGLEVFQIGNGGSDQYEWYIDKRS